MALRGITGDYGRRLRAVVISFGATARGAVRGLAAMGLTDVTVLTQRQVAAVASPIAFVEMQQFGQRPGRTPVVRSCSTAPSRGRWPSCWPSTTSWSTASCRTPTIR